MSALRSDGGCYLNLHADGSQITHLTAHVNDGTVIRAVEYPAESRVVLNLGERFTGSVDVFIGAAQLARLIDVLNDAYTRIACRSHESTSAAASAA